MFGVFALDSRVVVEKYRHSPIRLPVLERRMSNFIHALLVVIIGGIILLFVEYNIFSTDKTATSNIPPLERHTTEETDDTNLPKEQEILSDPLDNESKTLAEKLKLARTVFGVSARNKSLISVLKISLKIPDFEIAIEAADAIFGISARNKAYTLIIDEALKKRNISLARSMAEKLYGVSARNSQIQKILQSKW